MPFLIEGALDDPHQILRDLRAFVNRRNGEAILLGEVNLPPADVRKFLGDEDGDELHMVLDFIGNQALYLALARGSAEPLARALREFPEIPPAASLGRFVRNHDELTLDKLSEEERAEVFARFGPEKDMQLYGRGLRRRLPSMLDGDERAIRMAYSLAFSLPGTPVLFYGEEIGMAENPDDRGPLRRARADAVVARRRLLDGVRRCGGRWSRAPSAPSASTSPRSGATRTRC